MGWQADDDPRPGSTPGPGGSLPELLAAFEHGGAWDTAAPSERLAAALAAAAGPKGLYEGAEADAMVGIVRQWAALESWAAAETLGALRAMMREDGQGQALLRRRTDLPDGWSDSLNYEIAAALAMGPVSAGNLASLAWTLGTRLPGIGRLLANGTLTKPKAKLIVRTFEPLDEDEATRAEALIVGELAGKTWFQVERLAWRAALAVAPDIAERRRSEAERKRARVTIFREESGAAGLSGRDLPTAEALSGHANILSRAREYEASGAFPGHNTNSLEALAYLHLLNNITAQDAIAFARTATASPPENTTTRGQAEEDPSGEAGGGQSRGEDDDGPDGDEDDTGGGGTGGDSGPSDGSGPDDADDGPTGPEGRPVVPEVIAPLATLQGRAKRPGDNRLLGPLDPALTRDLAAAAARSPDARWEITIIDDHGYAAGHGVARARRGRRQRPRPPNPALCALPARVNIIVTEALLHQLAAQPRSGAPPGDWHFGPRTAKADDDAWVLTLPDGRELTVRFDMVPTHACDHRHEVSTYEPSERLRRLVQVRDHECTFPPCSRPAHESDFEHAVPFDHGGRTDACNAGARSRRCHRVKQSAGWTVTQPRPGWHVWITPTGRSYTQEPWRYIG